MWFSLFSWMSLRTAERIADVANVVFVISLLAGVAATIAIIGTASVKEWYWEQDRREAKVRADTLEAETARANEAAEELRAANLALEAQIAPRRLNPEQQEALEASWRPFAGRKVRISSYTLDAEGVALAVQIRALLIDAKLRVDDRILSQMAFRSVSLGVHVSGSDSAFADALAYGLRDLGKFQVELNSDPTTAAPIISAGPSEAAKIEVDASIFVGVKPVPMINE